MAITAIALTWPPSALHGWGVFGANLLRDLLRRGAPRPLCLAPIPEEFIDAGDLPLLRPVIAEQKQIEKQLSGSTGGITLNGVHVLHALGNHLAETPHAVRFFGQPNVGFTFFETTDFPATIVTDNTRFDIVMAGSTWNAEVLRELGFPRVGCVFQGVDTNAFRPGPGTGRFGERFVVFSGGKLELRKGQDLVIAAFKRFHARHPDALLVTVWMNAWPSIMRDVAASPHVTGHPDVTVPFPNCINDWVRAQGVPEGAHQDVSPVFNAGMPDLLRDCHAAVFTNRCEGGTNLVAMEALATGLPTVLAANNGHLDLFDTAAPDAHCYPVLHQTPTTFGPAGSVHWRESDVEEIVERLEQIYQDRAEAKRRGLAAAEFMKGWTWRHQIDHLLAAIDI